VAPLPGTGRCAAIRLGRYTEWLGLNAAVITSKRDRAAPTADIAGARFNDYFPLLMLNRPAQAAHLLRAQPSPALACHLAAAFIRALAGDPADGSQDAVRSAANDLREHPEGIVIPRDIEGPGRPDRRDPRHGPAPPHRDTRQGPGSARFRVRCSRDGGIAWREI
jgi:hypothetical protein